MKTMTVSELHEQLTKAGEGQAQEIRRHKAGSTGHQGDCYVHAIKKRPEAWDIETTDQTRQVAVGQGEGSNHRASGKVRIFWPKNTDIAAEQSPVQIFKNEPAARRVCLGPIIEAEEEWTLTHPKHAHHTFPAGIYQVTFQLDRRTMRRVQD